MPRFQKKPTQIDALQFSGGAANAQTIALEAAKVGVVVKWIPAHSEFELVNGVITETKYPELIRTRAPSGPEGEARVGDWFTVDMVGTLHIIPDIEFKALYQQV